MLNFHAVQRAAERHCLVLTDHDMEAIHASIRRGEGTFLLRLKDGKHLLSVPTRSHRIPVVYDPVNPYVVTVLSAHQARAQMLQAKPEQLPARAPAPAPPVAPPLVQAIRVPLGPGVAKSYPGLQGFTVHLEVAGRPGVPLLFHVLLTRERTVDRVRQGRVTVHGHAAAFALVACAVENHALPPRQGKSARRAVRLFQEVLKNHGVVLPSNDALAKPDFCPGRRC